MNTSARAQFYRLRSQLLASVTRHEVWQVRLPGGKAWMQWVEDDSRTGWEIHEINSSSPEFIEGPRDVTASIVATRLIAKSFDEQQLSSLESRHAALIRDAAAVSARDLLIRRLQVSIATRLSQCASDEQRSLLEAILQDLNDLSLLDPLQDPEYDTLTGATRDEPERR